jgi:hypothetical protein
MKPAFEEVVYNKPMVCAAYPINNQIPMNIPEKISFQEQSFICDRSKRISQNPSKIEAMIKRMPLKEKGSRNAIAF